MATLRAALQWRMRGLGKRVPRLLFDAGGDHTDSILIAGGGRTGTTWLLDILNWRNDYRTMYEPFNSGHVPVCGAFSSHQYLRPDDDDPRYLEPARRVFTGRIRNSWIDQYNRRFLARKRLIKDVRATLALRWVYEHFPGMPIVLTMRHPCATALSRAQMRWPGDFSHVLAQTDLVSEHLAPLRDALNDENDAFIRHLTLWCIEYHVVLKQFRPGEIFLAFYERLCTRSADDLMALCHYVGATYDNAMLEALSRPSVQAKRSRRMTPSAIVVGDDLLASWRSRITPDQYDRARGLLRRFGLDEVYGDGDVPNPEAALRLMGSIRPA